MKLDEIKKLKQKKYRNEFGHFLVEGEHLILELEKAANSNPLLKNSELYFTERYQDWQTSFKKTLVSEKQMRQFSDTDTPQGIIAVVPIIKNTATANDLSERVIYLNEIQDPGNLGTIFRTLAWFGGFRCLLSPDSVDPFNPKVVRASMGAIFTVPFELDVPLATLTTRFSKLIALDIEGESINSTGYKNGDCYIFGNEARGLPREQLSSLTVKSFTIPGNAGVESLNLAAAVNICAYELIR